MKTADAVEVRDVSFMTIDAVRDPTEFAGLTIDTVEQWLTPTYYWHVDDGTVHTNLLGEAFVLDQTPYASYINKAGLMILNTAGAFDNALRVESGGGLFEPAGKNILLDARNIDDASAAWVASYATGAQDATGTDGGANKATTLTDARADVAAYMNQDLSKGATDTNPFCVSVDIEKTTGATTFPALGIVYLGVATKRAYYVLNTNDGTITATNENDAENISGGVSAIRDSAGTVLWWRAYVTATDNGANTTVRGILFPAFNSDASNARGNASQGSAVFDCAQLEIGSYPSSYINTDGISIGAEIIASQTDRDFSGASNWDNVDLNAYDETTGGVLTITATAAGQYCTLPAANATTTANTTVVKIGVTVANITSTWTLTDFTGAQTLGTIAANGTHYFYPIPSTTGGFRIVSNTTTSSGEFDNFTMKTNGSVRLSEAGAYTFDALDKIFTGTDKGTIIVWAKMGFPETANVTNELLSTTAAASLLYHDGTNMSSTDGTNVAVDANPAWLYDGYVKFAIQFPSSTDKFRIGHDFDGGGISWGAEQTFDGAYTSTTLIIGRVIGAGFHIRNIEGWTSIVDPDTRSAYNY